MGYCYENKAVRIDFAVEFLQVVERVQHVQVPVHREEHYTRQVLAGQQVMATNQPAVYGAGPVVAGAAAPAPYGYAGAPYAPY